MKKSDSETTVAPDEQVLLACDEAIVTNKRVVLRASSYAASAIASVKVQHSKAPQKSRRIGLVLGISVAAVGIVLGAAGLYLAQDTPIIMAVFGLLGVSIVAAGILAIMTSLAPASPGHVPVYAVLIHTLDGQSERIAGLNRARAKQIADAISSATALN